MLNSNLVHLNVSCSRDACSAQTGCESRIQCREGPLKSVKVPLHSRLCFDHCYSTGLQYTEFDTVKMFKYLFINMFTLNLQDFVTSQPR